jgi:hypothetical protein
LTILHRPFLPLFDKFLLFLNRLTNFWSPQTFSRRGKKPLKRNLINFSVHQLTCPVPRSQPYFRASSVTNDRGRKTFE